MKLTTRMLAGQRETVFTNIDARLMARAITWAGAPVKCPAECPCGCMKMEPEVRT